jgi:hypothetical protein
MEIDPVTSTVVPGASTKNPMEVLLKTEQLQPELTAILADTNAADAELAAAINMADGRTPITQAVNQTFKQSLRVPRRPLTAGR